MHILGLGTNEKLDLENYAPEGQLRSYHAQVRIHDDGIICGGCDHEMDWQAVPEVSDEIKNKARTPRGELVKK